MTVLGPPNRVAAVLAAALAAGAAVWWIASRPPESVRRDSQEAAGGAQDPAPRGRPPAGLAGRRAQDARTGGRAVEREADEEEADRNTPSSAVAAPASAPRSIVEEPRAETVARARERVTAPGVLEGVVFGATPFDEVFVHLDAAPPQPGVAQTTRLAGDGTFRFGLVRPGAWRLRVLGIGAVERTWMVRIPESPDGNHRDVVVAGGATLEGALFDRLGKPATDRVVALVPDGQWSAYGWHPSVTARTDPRGRYRLERIRSGAYHAIAFLGDPAVSSADARSELIALAAGESKTLDFGGPRAEPKWSGTARLKSGTAIRGPKSLRLHDRARGRTVPVRIDGQGRFAQRVPPGTYRGELWLLAGGEHEFTFDLVVGDGDLEQDIAAAGVRVSGILRDAATGRPFPLEQKSRSARMVRVGVEEGEQFMELADADGVFAFDGVPPGRYEIFSWPFPRSLGGDGMSVVVDVGTEKDVTGIALEGRAWPPAK